MKNRTINRCVWLVVAIIIYGITTLSAQKIERVEPLNWWVGMNTPLHIMFYGEGLNGSKVSCQSDGVIVRKVHEAESPNYLFVDVEIEKGAEAGDYLFVIEQGGRRVEYTYRLEQRREGSAARGGFSSADMLYLLMPDRFANGDPSNDSVEGCNERANRSDTHGRHGGDIQGIIDHQDYFVDLGVTTIWSTPLVFDNDKQGSYHGYASADYYKIDPRFGSNELYRTMVKKGHEKGLKTIMDLVPNHCGLMHWWMADLPFRDWINNIDDPKMSNHQFGAIPDPNASPRELLLSTKGWFVPGMPDINFENPYVLQYFKQLAIWWVEWADLDGLRMDVFPYLEKEASAEWILAIMKEYPNFRVVAECWIRSPAMVAYWEGGNRNNRDGFDSNLPSVMDFPLQDILFKALEDGEDRKWNEGLMRIYDVVTQDFVYENPKNLLIFATNHDTDPLANLLHNDPRKVKLAMTMIATMRGIPQINVGSELMFFAESTKSDGAKRIDFDGGWSDDSRNLFEQSDRSDMEREVFDHTKKLLNWRKNAEVIHKGKTMHFAPQKNLYVYFRYLEDRCVMIAVNGAESEAKIDWERFSDMTSSYRTGIEITSGEKVVIGEPLTVKAMESVVIELER